MKLKQEIIIPLIFGFFFHSLSIILFLKYCVILQALWIFFSKLMSHKFIIKCLTPQSQVIFRWFCCHVKNAAARLENSPNKCDSRCNANWCWGKNVEKWKSFRIIRKKIWKKFRLAAVCASQWIFRFFNSAGEKNENSLGQRWGIKGIK